MVNKIISQIPWNKNKIIGQKQPFKLPEIWAIRIRLELSGKTRDLALFNLAIDNKLRACDLVSLRLRDISQGGTIQSRAIIVQKKTGGSVQFEITKNTKKSLQTWIEEAGIYPNDFLFKSRVKDSEHITTRQYSRIVHNWAMSIGLDHTLYGTHSLRRTKPSLIYKKTKNLRVVQLLLGHQKLESTVRYLGIEVDDALEISEKIDA
ncbi:MAG: tyrosine-type recombinase/integrase [Aestuariibacter sp.]